MTRRNRNDAAGLFRRKKKNRDVRSLHDRRWLRFEPLEDRRLLAGLEIQSLTTNNISLFSDHDSVTGDDRGGIAISDTHVYYSGDNDTGRFPINDLAAGVGVGTLFDALVSDLDTQQVYSLGSDDSTPIPSGGGTISHLLLHDGSTGALTGASVALSSAIDLNSDAGIFAGVDRVVVWNENTGDVSAVDTASGNVTALGNVAGLSFQLCENWAFWGVAEQFGGDDYLTYVQDSQTLVRTRISDGNTTLVASFPAGDLNDMCSFTLSAIDQRWYFHYEVSSAAETIGFADAEIRTGPFRLSSVSPDPRTAPVDFVDVTFEFPINSSTFDFNDVTLTLDGGANLIDASVTVTDLGSNVFRIGNLTSLTGREGSYLLTVVGAGIEDPGAIPLDGLSSERWSLNAHFPPLQPVAPLGSLIYDPAITRSLPAVTDVQALQIEVDAGQTITVLVQPNGTLQPSVTVTDPASAPLGSATATSPGEPLLLQTLPAISAGTYTVTIETAAGTTGDFTVQVFLNAALEPEQFGGPTNDTPPTAQDSDPSFISLSPAGAERGAVIGNVGNGGDVVDFFSFSLAAGDGASLVLDDAAGATLELFDSAGTLISVGATGATNVSSHISNFLAASADTYYARISSAAVTDYRLIVTRNATFDLELNSDLSSAQNIDPADGVLGHSGGSFELTTTSTAFAFEDISATGTDTGINTVCQETGDIPVGFDFNYFGQTENTIHALWNGTIRVGTGFGDVACTFSGAQTFPTPGGTGGDSLIAGWWATLFPVGGEVTYETLGVPGDRRFIVQYNDVPDAIGTPITFEIKIFERDSSIEVHYVNAPQTDGDSQNSAGIENQDGTQGIESFFGAGGVLANSAVRFFVRDDFYTISVNAGDNLQLTTLTPADDVREFVNLLDPRLELFDPTGASVASDDNSAGDGRNAVITHTATMTGNYAVRVGRSTGTEGEYVLQVTGNTGTLAPLTVVATNPADGEFVSFLGFIDVDFSASLNLSTADAFDLTVNGSPASSVTIVDNDTLRFDISALQGADGPYAIQIAAGAVSSISGTANLQFDMTLILDTVSPVVTGSTVSDGDVVASGNLSLVLTVNEPLNAGLLDVADVLLVDSRGFAVAASGLSYNGGTSEITIDFSGLTDELYTFRLFSGGASVVDLAGNGLNGGPSFPLPSGQGDPAADDFVFDFTVDSTTVPFPVPLNVVNPAGSLIYSGSVPRGYLQTADVDVYTLDLDAGQSLSVILNDTDPSLQAAVEVFDPNSDSVGMATASAAGDPVLLQSAPVTISGVYSIRVSALVGAGGFTLRALLNAATEAEQLGGPSNDSIGTFQELDGSFVGLRAGAAQRGAVIGNAGRGVFAVDRFLNTLRELDPLTGAELSSVTITVVGTPIIDALAMAKDPTTGELYAVIERTGFTGELVIVNPVTGEATSIADLNLGGQRFTELAFDASGTLYGVTGDSGANPESLFLIDKTNGLPTLLLALSAGGTGSGEGLAFNPDDGLLYRFQAGGLQSIHLTTLAVTNIPTSGSNPFQANALTYVADGRFLLVRGSQFFSLTTSGVIDLVSDISGAAVVHGLALPATGFDTFGFSLLAGQTTSLALVTSGSALNSSTLELLDSVGGVVATGIRTANLNQVIGNFAVATSGIYYARVSQVFPSDYSLVVTRDAAFDTELNSDLAIAQNIDGINTVLGHMGNGVEFAAYSTTFNFEDISATGTNSGISGVCQESGDIPVGFDFRFFGQTENTIHALWNGTLRVGTGFGDVACFYSGAQHLPTPGGLGGDSLIAGFWAALFPVGGEITYQTLGTPGDRRFIVQYDNISDNAGTLLTFQIKIFERDSSIEVHYVNAPQTDNETQNSVGVENQDGTQGIEYFYGTGGQPANSAVRFPGADDFYRITANAGEILSFATLTPADGVGEHTNNLDPRLELFDPSGASVATNDNGAADGRNAVLSFTAAVGGTYTLRVAGANFSTGEYVLDADAPGLTSFTRQTPATSPTNADTLIFRATFDDVVLGVDAADFAVAGTTATITGVSVVDTRTYDLTVSGGNLASVNSTVGINLSGTQNITDVAGNALPTIEPTTDQTYFVDNTAPSTTSFVRRTPAANLTNADTLVFRATFNEPVTDVDAADFEANGSTAGISVAVVSATQYDVTLSGGDLAGVNGIVGLNVAAAPTITDIAGNTLPNTEPATDETYLLDNLAPSATSFTRKTPAANSTNVNTLTFLATFSEDVTGVGTNDFVATGTSATISSVTQVTPSTYDVTLSGGDLANLNGIVGLNLAASPTITDLAGNALSNTEPGTDETYVVDNTAPSTTSFTRKTPATSPTNADTLVFLATFSEDVLGVGTNDFVVTGTTGSLSVMQVSASTYDVTISGGNLDSLNGVVQLNLAPAPTITDLAGNTLPNTAPPTNQSYLVDNIAPSATSFTRQNPATSPTNADTLVFRATFSDSVTGVDAGDFAITGTTATFNVAAVSATQYDITLTDGDLDGLNGTVSLNFAATPTIADLAGNALPNTEPTTDDQYVVDNTAPGTTSFTRKTPATTPTNADTLVFSATFNEGVTGVTADDFAVTGTTATISIAQLSASTYDVTISGGDLSNLNGTVGLNFVATPTITDLAGNALSSTEPVTDQTYLVDNTAPNTVSFTRKSPATTPTNADTLVFLATFNEDVTGVGGNDFTVTGTTAAINVTQVTPRTYDVSINGGNLADLNAIVGLNFAVAPTITDLAGNVLPNTEPATDETYLVDNAAPSTTSFALQIPAASPTNADTLVFRATFNEAVMGVDETDFAASGTTATIGVTPISGTQYDVTLTGGDLDGLNGTVGLNFAAGPTIMDLAGNALPNTEPATDQTYLVDNTAPGAASFVRQTPATSSTNADTLVFRATFNESVTGADAADFLASGTTAVLSVAAVSGTQYDITLSGGDLDSLNGVVGLNFAATPTIADLAGNALPNTEPPTDETYLLDNSVPTTTSFTRKTPATSPTNADTLVFLATFSEDVIGVAADDFAATGTTGTISVAQVSASTYDVTISGGNLAGLNGTVGLNFSGTTTIADLAGNGLFNIEPATDDLYVVDNAAPSTVSFARQTPATSPTNADTLVFRATFSEPITGVDAADFAASGTTATISVAAVSGSQYDVTLSGGDLAGLNGTVGLNFNAPTIADLAGNALPNVEPVTDQTYLLDNIAPVATSFARQTPAASPINANTLVFRATFSKPVTGVAAADFAASGTTATLSVAAVSTTQYDVTLSGGDLASLNGTVGLNFNAPTIADLAGNAVPTTEPATDQTYVVDNLAPSATSFARQSPATSPTNADTLVFRATFSEPVTGVDAADFAASGTTAALSVAAVSSTQYDVTLTGGDLPNLDGTVGLNFAAAPTIADLAGNALPNTEPATDETYEVINNAPPSVALQNTTTSLAENTSTSPRIKVADIVITDDAQGSNTLSLSGADAALFQIDLGVLFLKAGAVLNFETNPTLDVTVAVDDSAVGATPDGTAPFSIAVTDINEPPTDITLSTNSVAENAAGANIGTLTATDPDAGDAHTFAVSDGRFEVVASQLKLKAGQSLNFETEPTVFLNVTARDTGGLEFIESFTVTVTNVNEPPSNISLSANTVAENSAGATIGTLTVTDPESGDTHTLTVSDARFEIVAAQLKLKAGQSLDFETEPTVSLDVTAQDGGGLPFTKSFTINVTNANDAPTAILLSNATLRERLSGETVGALSATDPDVGQTHTFAVVSDTRFEVVGGMLKLKADQFLDRTAGTTVSVELSTTDNGAPPQTFRETLVLTVAANPHPWQNPINPLDADNDPAHTVAPIDALVGINLINDPGTLLGPGGRLPAARPADSTLPYYDVDGDDFAAAIDVVQVINFINGEPEGEGEFSLDSLSSPAPFQLTPPPNSPRELTVQPRSATTIATLSSTARNLAEDSWSSSLGRAARRARELEAVLTDIAADVVRGNAKRLSTAS